jgi:hypothetical protein
MNKEELLNEISAKVNSGEISRQELMNRFNLAPQGQPTEHFTQKSAPSNFSVTKMLYVLGALIVVIGIVIFFYQVWEDIGSFVRILITLGLGFIITALGSILIKDKPQDNIGLVFQFIGGMLIPGGALVMLHELDVSEQTLWPFAITFGIISLFYALLNYVHKNVVLTFFTIAHTTTFIYLLVGAMLDGSYYDTGEIYAYLTMFIGASYLLLAHAFRSSWNSGIVSMLCFFGSIAFLGAAFSRVFDSELWQMFYFIVILCGFYLSIYMKSRAILTMSTIFLIAHMSYITGEYFADSIGWPVSLVVLGLLFIGLGYVSINIGKKYITK